MEDERINALEGELGQARLIAEESDKKYEEVRTVIEQLTITLTNHLTSTTKAITTIRKN